jgi:hypothetical protein
MKNHKFILEKTNELLNEDFSVLLYNKNYIYDNYCGWVDFEKKEFVCAIKNFNVFIHEYCHFLQWKENKNCINQELYEVLFNWINGNEYDSDLLNKSFYHIIEIERDCELKSINLISKYNLNVDVKQYIKQANSYLFSYYLNKKYRKNPKTPIYLTNVINYMPETILDINDYINGPSIDLENIFLKEY